MKTKRHNNEANEKTNTLLRRKTMNFTKFAMIVFSATAIIAGGCSKDTRITAPGNGESSDISKDLVELNTPVAEESNSARIAVESFAEKFERTDFVAMVKRSAVEGGCWYLEDANYDRYTPYFGEKAPDLYVGLKLHVYGYIDEYMNSFCMIGPVFHVEKYELLSRNIPGHTEDFDTEIILDAAATTATRNAETNDSAASAAGSISAQTVLKGYYGSNDEGCMYITDGKDVIAELYFTQRICPNIPNGTPIAVKGDYSLLTWSPCALAPLFNVDTYELFKKDNRVADIGVAGK